MELELRINGIIESVQVPVNETLLTMLRRQGYYSVKQGCEIGECGACTVLVDGVPRSSCIMLAGQAGGCALTTVEGLGPTRKLHPLQEAFVEMGAVQCGFCTPGMLLSAYALLKRNARPTERDVRDALSGHLCSCTGYVKPVQAVMHAAARMRGEPVPPGGSRALTGSDARLQTVGKAVPARDAVKLVTGKSAFTGDVLPQGMLYGRILPSPHAYAVIRNIDVSQAKALPGVHAVLTYKDVPQIAYSGVEHFPTDSGPSDAYCLDSTLRYVGDRVAAVAAETPEIAEQALRLIRVDYDVLPAILELRRALESDRPQLHPEPESRNIADATHNVAARVRSEVGDVAHGFAQADLVIESEYTVPQVQQVPLENSTVITYFDEDDYLVVRTDLQALSHIRRTLSSILSTPARRIRVVKANAHGNLGVKQEIVLEDLCALLTETTNRPVKLTYSQADELRSSRFSHTHILRLKTGVKRDGTIVANQMIVIAGTGAHATHPLATSREGYLPALSLYPCANMRYIAEVLYTNLPPAMACRSSSMPQEFFALECHMDEIARRLGMDALAVRRKNWVRPGDAHMLVRGVRDKTPLVESCGLAECLRIVEEKLNWGEKRGRVEQSQRKAIHGGHERFRHGVGVALSLDSTLAMGTSGSILKLNDDGSFDLLVSDGGPGFTTLLAQVAAEVLSVSLENILLHPTDTSNTLSNINAHAMPYNSIGAVQKAAEQMRRQILAVAGRMLNTRPETLNLVKSNITAPGEQSTTIAQVASHALYVEGRHLVVSASWKPQQTATTFAAQGVEVEVDIETGGVRILKAITAVDGGLFINPLLAEGQIQGSATQALGASICEELIYGQNGALLTTRLSDYHVYNALDMPEMQTFLVETDDASVPFGAKMVATVPLNGMAPAVANAVADALGRGIQQLPLTPERVLRALHAQKR